MMNQPISTPEPEEEYLTSIWQSLLAKFKPEIAGRLYPILQQLNDFLPEKPFMPERGIDEFDGFGGVVSRGNYERLLISEWALLEEIPEEFMRKVVMNEQLFLEPFYQSPKTSRKCVLLFDTGMFQLGNCRVFHSALWLLFAERCFRENIELWVGSLQTPTELTLVTEIKHLRAILNKRCFTPVTIEHLMAWQIFLKKNILATTDDHRKTVLDMWLIGDLSQSLSENFLLSHQLIHIHEDILSNTIELKHYSAFYKQLNQTSFNFESNYSDISLLKGKFFQPFKPQKTEPSTDTYTPNSGLLLFKDSVFLSADEDYLSIAFHDKKLITYRIPKENNIKFKRINSQQLPHKEDLIGGQYCYRLRKFIGLINKYTVDSVEITIWGDDTLTEIPIDNFSKQYHFIGLIIDTQRNIPIVAFGQRNHFIAQLSPASAYQQIHYFAHDYDILSVKQTNSATLQFCLYDRKLQKLYIGLVDEERFFNNTFTLLYRLKDGYAYAQTYASKPLLNIYCQSYQYSYYQFGNQIFSYYLIYEDEPDNLYLREHDNDICVGSVGKTEWLEMVNDDLLGISEDRLKLISINKQNEKECFVSETSIISVKFTKPHILVLTENYRLYFIQKSQFKLVSYLDLTTHKTHFLADTD